jgi:hypothetical protein
MYWIDLLGLTTLVVALDPAEGLARTQRASPLGAIHMKYTCYLAYNMLFVMLRCHELSATVILYIAGQYT